MEKDKFQEERRIRKEKDKFQEERRIRKENKSKIKRESVLSKMRERIKQLNINNIDMYVLYYKKDGRRTYLYCGNDIKEARMVRNICNGGDNYIELEHIEINDNLTNY